jgi:hypothetical protein
MEKTDMTNSRYWVEYLDCWDDDIQKSIYMHGESVEQIKLIMDEYELVVIDNTEVAEQPYWGRERMQTGRNAGLLNQQKED